jgi:VWFA-related protein
VRIIIECPENILHLEAGYIYADCPFVNFNPLAVRRRTIHFRQLTVHLRSLWPVNVGNRATFPTVSFTKSVYNRCRVRLRKKYGMTKSSHHIARILPIFIGILWSLEQSPGSTQTGPARVVSLPVTVMNRSGEPVPGLNASSFSLLQGGRKQTLDSALEVAPITVGKTKTKIAFVVLDAIGSPAKIQGEERKECLQLLADAVTNESPISLSEIDHDGLHVVHEIATRGPVLASALLQLDKESRFLIRRDQLEAIGLTTEDTSLVEAEAERLRRFRHGTIENANMMGTLLAQLKALQDMAVALQRAHGRKTVIWLTGWFPIEINDAQDSINVNSYGITSGFSVKSASIDYQRTVDLLNDAQISIFPIDIGGGGFRSTIGLRQIAQSTAGEYMANSDALQNLVKRAEDRSTAYYLLTFRPETIKTDLKWTRLEIKLSDESLRVTSPSGLFVFAAPK